MKLTEIPDYLRPYVEFGCMVCLEKRNATKSSHKDSPCALRKVCGEVCYEMKQVITSVENKAVEAMVEPLKWNKEVPMLETKNLPNWIEGNDPWNYFRQGVKVTTDVVNTVGGKDNE